MGGSLPVRTRLATCAPVNIHHPPPCRVPVTLPPTAQAIPPAILARLSNTCVPLPGPTNMASRHHTAHPSTLAPSRCWPLHPQPPRLCAPAGSVLRRTPSGSGFVHGTSYATARWFACALPQRHMLPRKQSWVHMWWRCRLSKRLCTQTSDRMEGTHISKRA